MGTLMSKGNVQSAEAIPEESAMIYRCTRNGLTEKAKKATRRNRSVTQFSEVLGDLVEFRGNLMDYITLFEEPFPEPQRMEEILDKLWQDAEMQHDKNYTRYNKIDAYVCHWGLHYLPERH